MILPARLLGHQIDRLNLNLIFMIDLLFDSEVDFLFFFSF